MVCEPFRYVHNSCCAGQGITNCNCREDLKTSSSLTLGKLDRRRQPCVKTFEYSQYSQKGGRISAQNRRLLKYFYSRSNIADFPFSTICMKNESPVEVTFAFICIKRDQRSCIWAIQLRNITLISTSITGVYKRFTVLTAFNSASVKIYLKRNL